MKKLIILTGLLSGIIFSQSVENRKGSISFISSGNIYVKFISTEGINEGDTLYFVNNGDITPVIIARFISSTSVAGERTGEYNLKTGDEVIARIIVKVDSLKIIVKNNEPPDQLQTSSLISRNYTPQNKERINGRFSIQSYSNISNAPRGDYQRWRYTLSIKGKNIGESAVSVTSHFNFNYKADEWNTIKENPANNIRVYDLAVKYDFSQSSSIIVGRHLNEKITNISSIDGIQYNGGFGNFNTGIFAGSRPDFSNMGFNIKLFQAGVYLNRSDTINNKSIENTIAFVNQTNDFKTDRRLLYFQHTNNYIQSLSFFLSAEADLYKKINNQSKNELSVTGLFFSARYNPFNFASLNLSYDARRNVIYYETFRNYLETLLDNEMRQGLRGSINIRPIANLYTGFNAGYRFRKGDPVPSNDLGAYISYTSLPYIFISPSLSYTRIKSSYISGNIYGVMVSKNIDLINSNLSITYRNSDYTFSQDIRSVQNSVSADISAKIIRQIYFSIGWEGIFEGNRTAGRVLLDLTSRL